MTSSNRTPKQYQRSPIKWPGSKFKLLDTILPLIEGYEKITEAFAGSASVLLNHQFNEGVINDKNKHLINFYRVVQTRPEALIKELKKLFKPRHNCAESYYLMREKFNQSRNGVTSAALFTYLSKHAFNGIMRWNSNDKFNTPFGSFSTIRLPEEAIYALHYKLQNVKIMHGDFQDCFLDKNMGENSVFLIDPPYIELSKTANFTSYTGNGFSFDDHRRLSDLILHAQQRGVKTIACNHDLPITRDLHAKADKIISIKVPRYLSCKGKKRHPVKELLAIYEPH